MSFDCFQYAGGAVDGRVEDIFHRVCELDWEGRSCMDDVVE
jgi:hypothetical protein